MGSYSKIRSWKRWLCQIDTSVAIAAWKIADYFTAFSMTHIWWHICLSVQQGTRTGCLKYSDLCMRDECWSCWGQFIPASSSFRSEGRSVSTNTWCPHNFLPDSGTRNRFAYLSYVGHLTVLRQDLRILFTVSLTLVTTVVKTRPSYGHGVEFFLTILAIFRDSSSLDIGGRTHFWWGVYDRRFIAWRTGEENA